jgi:hypothetical protein
MPRSVAKRPNFNQAIRALLKDVSSSMAEFSHIKPSRIVVVAGEARRASRATVKPLTFEGGKSSDFLGRRKPIVRIKGKRMLYSITLRPLFFRSSTPQGRIGTLLHELYHISSRFDGTLDDERRHSTLKGFDRKLRPLLRRYLKRVPPELYASFAHDGEVRMLHWLERPGAQFFTGRPKMRRVYTEEQLYWGVVRMITRRTRPPQRVRKDGPQLH